MLSSFGSTELVIFFNPDILVKKNRTKVKIKNMKEVLRFLLIAIPIIVFITLTVMDIMGAFKVTESRNYKTHKN